MPHAATEPPHPLQLGQVLYQIQETTLIYVPRGESHARYERVSFAGSVAADPRTVETSPTAQVADAIELGQLDDILDARTITQWNDGKQQIALLTKAGLSSIVFDNGRSRLTSVDAKISDAVLMIGLDPTRPDKRSLALLVSSGGDFAVVRVDMDSGASGAPRRLPPAVKGTAVAAELIRRGLKAMLMIATVSEASLCVHAIAWDDLFAAWNDPAAADLPAGQVTTVTLGKAFIDDRPHVAVTAARLWAKASDQQLAVVWADTASSCSLALVGWAADGASTGKAVLLAKTTPDLAFAAPEIPLYRLAAADVMHKGTEQLVLGYPATCGAVKGCAALLLFSVDNSSSQASSPDLQCISRYAAANTDGQPLANHDLHLGAGVFGSCMGVQITGGASSVKQLLKGEVSVVCGFVPVDPTTGFPARDGNIPGVPQMCRRPSGERDGLAAMGWNAPRFHAIASDVTGQSVVLGPPKFSVAHNCAQILAIVQAPPFDDRTKGSTLPSVGFAESIGKVSGYSVSSNNAWTMSSDIGLSLGIGTLNLSRTMHESYGESFDKIKDSSFTKTYSFHITFSEDDMLHEYGISYNVWRYPVLRSSKQQEPGGELVVIFPIEASIVEGWRPAHHYAYRPVSEVGCLPSYLNVGKDGYDEAKTVLLFERRSIPVGASTQTASIAYDSGSSTTDTDSHHFNVLNSLAYHASLTGSTELFEEVPVTFGINIGQSSSTSHSTVETTHITVHSNTSLSFSSGSVEKPDYEYQVTPVIYVHDKLGCLMLTWDVELAGKGWSTDDGKASLTEAQLRLVRPTPHIETALNNLLSRAIAFSENPAGTIDVTAEIFNNGLRSARKVACKFFLGKPTKDGKAPETYLGAATWNEAELKPFERVKLKLSGQDFSKCEQPVHVTAQPFWNWQSAAAPGTPGPTYWNEIPKTLLAAPEKHHA